MNGTTTISMHCPTCAETTLADLISIADFMDEAEPGSRDDATPASARRQRSGFDSAGDNPDDDHTDDDRDATAVNGAHIGTGAMAASIAPDADNLDEPVETDGMDIVGACVACGTALLVDPVLYRVRRPAVRIAA